MQSSEAPLPSRASAADLRLAPQWLRLLDAMIKAIDRAILPTRMMEASLGALVHATGAAGAASIGQTATAVPSAPPGLIAAATLQLATVAGHAHATELVGHATLLCPVATRFGAADGIALWRMPGAPPWAEVDCALVETLGPVLRIVLDQAVLSAALAQGIRTDLMTGLGNHAAFVSELPRRIERLERDGLPGAVLHVELAAPPALECAGHHEEAELSIRMAAALLRNTVRPSDLLARLGTSSFAAWLDGADELSGAERAATLCRTAPLLLARRLSSAGVRQAFAIGVAARWPGSGEEAADIMRRAAKAAAMAQKESGWKVAPPPGC